MSASPSEQQPLASSPATPVTPAQADSSPKLRYTLVSFSAAVLVLSFFLPWIPFLGANLSGMDIQKNFSSYQLVWLMPLLALIALILNLARQNAGFIRRIAGLCPYAILVYSMNRLGSDLIKHLELGAWLALIAGAALVFIPGERKPTTPA